MISKISESMKYKIQLLRGLAIIAVVFIHNTPNGLLQVYLRPFMNFSVGLFLFLSGMLTSTDNWHPKKRITKVLVPYVVWTFVYSLIACLKHPIKLPILFIKNILKASSATMMYYIYIYIELTLLVPLINKMAKSKYYLWWLLISPIEVVMFRLMPILFRIEFNYYGSILISISCVGWFSYYYLGYLLGNSIASIYKTSKTIVVLWIVSIFLQMIEGYWYYTLGSNNAGTQLKLTALISGSLFAILAFRFINSDYKLKINFLKRLGDISFGVYFSHVAVMIALNKIPAYASLAIYPLNAIITIIVSSICVIVGRKTLGKYGKYLAL